jgi:hypothetical protein
MRLLLAGLLLALGSQVANAHEKFGMAGCGWGSMIFGTENQVLAATFNSSGANQGFGISSGTSNCLPANQAAAVQAQQVFFAENMQILSKEIAQGNGEYVKALAKTMGCKEESHPAFASEMQKSYSYIFSAPGAMSSLDRVRSTIHENKDLNASCDTII